MKRTFKIIKYIILLSPLWILACINIRLHTIPNIENEEETKKDVVLQLDFLKEQLRNNNLGTATQQLYPEGFVFINTLYGLAWTEIGINEKKESEWHKQAILESRFAYKEISSDYAKSDFDFDLNPHYGAFYSGWKNFLLGKILSIQEKKDSTETKEFISNCDSIATAISKSNTPFLESYYDASWPADNFVAVASLKLHDKIFEPKYDTVIKNWITKVKAHLDPETGLIPHAVDSKNGATGIHARGSSICLILIFLADIDPAFAQDQFEIFKTKFLITRFGFLTVREYPIGKDGFGDVDSGPVIWDIGFAGTIVSTGTFKKFGEYDAANNISACIEGFGFPLSNGEKKKYLFGQLPITDAFFVWTRIQEPNKDLLLMKQSNIELGSSVMFHIVSLSVILIVIYFVRKKEKRIGMIEQQKKQNQS